MITIVMKDGAVQNYDGEVERDGNILMIYDLTDKDGVGSLISEMNDTWSHWYEQSITVRKEE